MKDYKKFIFKSLIGILCILIGILYILCSNSDTTTGYDFSPVVANTSEFDIEFGINSDWGSGFEAEICITNTSDKAINDWGIGFDFDREIISFSGAEIVSEKNNHFIIKSSVYNNLIQPNETVTVTFLAEGDSNSKPANYTLTKRPDSTEIENNDSLTRTYRKKRRAYRRAYRRLRR